MIEDRWPGKVTIHTKGMSDDMANQMARALDDLVRRYPDVARGISHVGDAVSVTKAVNAEGVRRVKPMSKRDVAEARKVGETSILRFDVKKLSDADMLAARERDGYLARGSIDGVVRHEFGHIWHQERFTVKEGPLKGFTTPEAEEVIARTVAEFTEPGISNVGDVLSRYGATNEKEMLAEAFSDVSVARSSGDSAHPFAKTLIERLEAL